MPHRMRTSDSGSMMDFLSEKFKKRISRALDPKQVPENDSTTLHAEVPPEIAVNGDESAGAEWKPGVDGAATSQPVNGWVNHNGGNNNERQGTEVSFKAFVDDFSSGRINDNMTTSKGDNSDDGNHNYNNTDNANNNNISNNNNNEGIQIFGQDLDHRGTTGYGANRRSLVDIFEHPTGTATDPSSEASRSAGQDSNNKVMKLSSERMQELMSSPESVPYRTLVSDDGGKGEEGVREDLPETESEALGGDSSLIKARGRKDSQTGRGRPATPRTVSTPVTSRRRMPSSSNSEYVLSQAPRQTKGDRPGTSGSTRRDSEQKSSNVRAQQISDRYVERSPSPLGSSIPLPPFSMPTYLQLELESGQPSPLYVHRSALSDFPYESSRVKLERLLNFLVLPPVLEQVLWFGTLACLDSWLYTFTILPLRFVKALYILLESWAVNIGAEVRYVSTFIFKGVGRVWRRRTQLPPEAEAQRGRNIPGSSTKVENPSGSDRDRDVRKRSISVDPGRRHTRRSETRKPHQYRQKQTMPSALLPDDKADILKGLLMIATCSVLMHFDASRMYHWIRGQAAIKLYVIYNVLEVSDRLFGAIGQDVLECLFSREALERKPDGRSKVLRPFWLFLLALTYTVLHSTALFYQVMTLNVAVNSYSNALITLLLSNQFVEIKSSVFKKFEKENLFQITCADVVERFQLWLMLTIIALRNIVETGAFDIFGMLGSSLGGSNPSTGTNSTPHSTPPRTATSILPKSFTLFPSSLIASFSGDANSFISTLGQVLGPFLIVLGSEMLVDWLKHAYINKFNNTRPSIYGRFLDILAKDYYTNAFGDQNLTRRLGLPVIPLSCLFFRVSVQTYHMFLASLVPYSASSPSSSSTTTAVEDPNFTPMHMSGSGSGSALSMAAAAAAAGAGGNGNGNGTPFTTRKSLIPTLTTRLGTFFRTILANVMPTPARSVQIFTVVLITTGFIILLILKLMLEMILLNLARSRYKSIKNSEIDRHRQHHHHHHNNNYLHPLHHHSNNNRRYSQGATATAINNPNSNSYNSNNSSNDESWGATAAAAPLAATGLSGRERTSSRQNSHGYAVEGSRRIGSWGVVEVDDSKRRYIYADDQEGLKKLKEKEEKEKEKNVKESKGEGNGIGGMEHVTRYEMVAKRIW